MDLISMHSTSFKTADQTWKLFICLHEMSIYCCYFMMTLDDFGMQKFHVAAAMTGVFAFLVVVVVANTIYVKCLDPNYEDSRLETIISEGGSWDDYEQSRQDSEGSVSENSESSSWSYQPEGSYSPRHIGIQKAEPSEEWHGENSASFSDAYEHSLEKLKDSLDPSQQAELSNVLSTLVKALTQENDKNESKDHNKNLMIEESKENGNDQNEHTSKENGNESEDQNENLMIEESKEQTASRPLTANSISDSGQSSNSQDQDKAPITEESEESNIILIP